MKHPIYTGAADRWNKQYQYFRDMGYKVPKDFTSVRDSIEVICPVHGSHTMSARAKTPCGRCGEILRVITAVTGTETGTYDFGDAILFMKWVKKKQINIKEYKLGYLIRDYLNED